MPDGRVGTNLSSLDFWLRTDAFGNPDSPTLYQGALSGTATWHLETPGVSWHTEPKVRSRDGEQICGVLQPTPILEGSYHGCLCCLKPSKIGRGQVGSTPAPTANALPQQANLTSDLLGLLQHKVRREGTHKARKEIESRVCSGNVPHVIGIPGARNGKCQEYFVDGDGAEEKVGGGYSAIR